MSRKYSSHIKHIMFPCFVLSALTGMFTGVLIFLFKISASFVISSSDKVYALVRENPAFLPLLILGAAAIGGISYLLIKVFPSCRGGDSQTTITVLRGFLPINWISNTLVMFFSALINYFAGMPLGEEGTSVQMGAAVGKGTVTIFAKKGNERAWERYIMTGGACGGFAAATSSPLTAILFAFDEAHRRFSPIIFMASATATLSSYTTMHLLCSAFNVEPRLFVFEHLEVLPLKYMWAPVVVGIVCGLLAVLYAKSYKLIAILLNRRMKKVPAAVKYISVFVIIAVFGFFSAELVGSGHNIIHHLIEGHAPVWYLLLLYLVIRSVTFLVTSDLAIVGGLSVPAMAVGAILGSLSAKMLTAMGIFPEKYAPILVIVGVAAFLGATNRAPLNAITFACEALMGFTNLVPVAIGVAFSFIVIEPLGVEAFSDILIEKKIHRASKGKEMHIVDAHLTVSADAFITGKEVRDILFPANCVVLSVDKSHPSELIVEEGDVVHVRYKTYTPEDTYAVLESIMGKQSGDPWVHDVHEGDDSYTIPEQ